MTADYICKVNHERVYWINKDKYHFTFVYGNVYSITTLKQSILLHLEYTDIEIFYTKDSFKNKFKKNDIT